MTAIGHAADGQPPAATESTSSPAKTVDTLFASLKKERNAVKARSIANQIASEWNDSGSATINLLMQWAGEAADEKRNAAAYDFLDQVILLDPDYVQAPYRRAMVHFSDGDTRKAQRFYQEWLGGKADYSETTLEGIPIVGARDGNFRITVEFRPLPSGKQQVRISSAWLHGAVPQLVSEQLQRRSYLAVPMGTDEFSDTFSFDADRVNRTTVWGNTLSVEANELYIREQALVAGWTVLSRKTIKGGTRAQVVLRRGGQEAVIAIAHNGVGCSIVVSNTLPQA